MASGDLFIKIFLLLWRYLLSHDMKILSNSKLFICLKTAMLLFNFFPAHLHILHNLSDIYVVFFSSSVF